LNGPRLMDLETKLCGPAGTHTTASHLTTHQPCIMTVVRNTSALDALRQQCHLEGHMGRAFASPKLISDVRHPGRPERRVRPVVVCQHHLSGRRRRPQTTQSCQVRRISHVSIPLMCLPPARRHCALAATHAATFSDPTAQLVRHLQYLLTYGDDDSDGRCCEDNMAAAHPAAPRASCLGAITKMCRTMQRRAVWICQERYIGYMPVDPRSHLDFDV